MPLMHVVDATNAESWDKFLSRQPWSPFLQSWKMGTVYEAIGQDAVRIVIEENEQTLGVAFGHIVPARRGKHIAVPYGPVVDASLPKEKQDEVSKSLMSALQDRAKKHGAACVRISPWLEEGTELSMKTVSSPLHLLAEHVWYIGLTGKSEDDILSTMRKNTRNLIRRAEKDGVTVEASTNPNEDIKYFLALHDETRKRHGFTPYTNDFFRAQVREFAGSNQCTVYLARHEGRVIASSIHIHAFGETSYHHGASEQTKVPASYLLQWTAIQDALKRGDTFYNFWGIAPTTTDNDGKVQIPKKHPFAGVTLFKTGFGGELLNLMHCRDIPTSYKYWITYGIESIRKWRRGF